MICIYQRPHGAAVKHATHQQNPFINNEKILTQMNRTMLFYCDDKIIIIFVFYYYYKKLLIMSWNKKFTVKDGQVYKLLYISRISWLLLWRELILISSYIQDELVHCLKWKRIERTDSDMDEQYRCFFMTYLDTDC